MEKSDYYDADNLTQCAAFIDGKRKLRMVLSGVGFLPTWYTRLVSNTERDWYTESLSRDGLSSRSEEGAKEDLMALLRVLLAEAVNGRERAHCAQIRETIRCLALFTPRE